MFPSGADGGEGVEQAALHGAPLRKVEGPAQAGHNPHIAHLPKQNGSMKQLCVYNTLCIFYRGPLAKKNCLNPGEDSLKGELPIDTTFDPPFVLAGQSL